MSSTENPRPRSVPEADAGAADDSALAEFLDVLTAAMRSGRPAGPELERFQRQRPDMAEELRSLLATVQMAEEMARDDWIDEELETDANKGEAEPPPSPLAPPSPIASIAASGSSAPGSSARWIGGYELCEELGRGGMGIVFRARDGARGRAVALKRLLRGPDSQPRDLKRFQAESQAASRLAHPHIVPVLEVGEHDGLPYFTMQYIEGTTLARTLVDGPLKGPDAARLLVPVCRAVHYAHERGVLHRDLKPSNILIDLEGNPYVSDFGLAKRIDVGASLTPSDALLGTPSYMAPEQAGRAAGGRRSAPGPSSDVYSLGAVLYHAITGRPPFQAATPVETILLALEHEPVPPRALNPRVSPDLEMIALKCLQKHHAARYATAAELAEDLEAFLRGDPVSARSTSLRALAARLLAETHHAPVLENWGLLWMYHSAALLVFFGATNGLYLAGVSARWPYVLIFTVGLCGWAAVFWALRRRGGPIEFVERQLAHVWGAAIVAINLIFLVEWLLDMPVLRLAPVIAVVNGTMFLIKGGILSGGFYLQAAVTFLAIFPMAAFPRFAPIIFGVVAAACFFATGLKYQLRRMRSP